MRSYKVHEGGSYWGRVRGEEVQKCLAGSFLLYSGKVSPPPASRIIDPCRLTELQTGPHHILKRLWQKVSTNHYYNYIVLLLRQFFGLFIYAAKYIFPGTSILNRVRTVQIEIEPKQFKGYLVEPTPEGRIFNFKSYDPFLFFITQCFQNDHIRVFP